MSRLGRRSAGLAAVVLAGVTLYTLTRAGRLLAKIFIFTTEGRRIGIGSGEAWALSSAYAGAMLVVLLAHEYGHWRTARAAGLRTSGPFLLPWWPAWSAVLPLPAFGTVGAFVRVHGLSAAPAVDRWRVAVAGPLYGFASALTVLALGAWLSVASERAIGHPYVPHVAAAVLNGTAWHPVAIAGWLGLLLNGLNLLPLPWLDGWHMIGAAPDLTRRYQWATLGAFGLCAICLW